MTMIPIDEMSADAFRELHKAYLEDEGRPEKYPSLVDALEVTRDCLCNILDEPAPTNIPADLRHRLESLEGVATWALVMYRAAIEAVN